MRAILKDCLNGSADSIRRSAELGRTAGFDRCAAECVGLDGRAIRKMVANALASTPQTAMNPEQVTIEDLLAAARAAKAGRVRETSQMSTVARRTLQEHPAARRAPDLDGDRRPADARARPALRGPSCLPSPASPPASSPIRRRRTQRSS